MKKILAPTDFSAISVNAVNYAADMACAINANLILFNVCMSPLAFSEIPYPAENIVALTGEAEEKIKNLKNELDLRTGGRIQIDTEVRMGTVIVEIENYCSEQKPYAVIIGTQGSSAFEKMLFGSKTVAAIKHLPCPVVVIPPEAKFTKPKKIGLACDLKKVDETIPIEEIRMLVKEFNAELNVLHVNTSNEKNYSPDTMIETHSLQKLLGEMNPVYHFLNNSDIEEGLEKFAEKNKLDLLIIIPKKHNFFDQLFHHSHSKKMARHIPIPLMAVHE